MSAVFGPAVDNEDVEVAVTTTIEAWIDSYLAATERRKGLTVGFIARPRSYNDTWDYDNWPEGQLPAISVVCPGTVGEPMLRGSGMYSAWFEVNVNVIVTDQTEAATRSVAARYQSALTLLLNQQDGLRGATNTTDFAVDVNWMGWTLELPTTDNRTLAVGTVLLHVLVDDIFDATAGPLEVPSPPEADPGNWPTVTQQPGITVETDPLTPQ